MQRSILGLREHESRSQEIVLRSSILCHLPPSCSRLHLPRHPQQEIDLAQAQAQAQALAQAQIQAQIPAFLAEVHAAVEAQARIQGPQVLVGEVQVGNVYSANSLVVVS